MSAPKDGGPAFPRVAHEVLNSGFGDFHFAQDGMSLRDYFAGQALAGFLANQEAARAVVKAAHSSDDANQRFAITAYDLADAMLAQRERNK